MSAMWLHSTLKQITSSEQSRIYIFLAMTL